MTSPTVPIGPTVIGTSPPRPSSLELGLGLNPGPKAVERCDQGHEIEAWRLPPGFAHSTPPTPPQCQCYLAADATVLPFRPRSSR